MVQGMQRKKMGLFSVLLVLAPTLWAQVVIAPSYTLALNTQVNSSINVPDNGTQVVNVTSNSNVTITLTPTLTVTGGTTPPLPDDTNIMITYPTALVLDTVALNSDPNWSCDTSTTGQAGCSLISVATWPTLPTLPLQFTAPASGGPFNVNANATPVFINGNPPGSIVNSTSVDVGIQIGAASADLGLQLQVSPNPVATNDFVYMDVLWSNNGPDAANNAQFSINLPAGVSQIGVSTTNNPWSCTTTGTTVNCTQTTVASGSSGTVYISFAPPTSAGNWSITGSIAATESDPNTSNDTASVTLVTELPVTDASISAGFQPAQALPGDSVNLIIHVRNEGNQYVDAFPLVQVPAGLNFTGFTAPSGWECKPTTQPQQLFCGLVGQPAPIAGRSDRAITGIPGFNVGFDENFILNFDVSLAVSAPQLTATASLQPSYSPPVDDNAGNDSSTAVLQLGSPEADLSVEKTAVFTPPLAVGDVFTYQIKVTNHGPQPAPNVVIEDQLADNVELLSVSAPFGWTCLPDSGIGVQMQCNFDRSLSPPDSQTIEQTVRYLGNGEVITTHATVNSGADDPVPDNNAAERTDNIITGSQVDLVLSQTASGTQLVQGEMLTMTYVIQNRGSGPASNVQLSIQHGSLLAFQSKVGPDWSCAAQGSSTVCGLTGTLNSGASQSLSVDFQAAETDGSVDLQSSVASAETDANIGDNSQTTRITIGTGGNADPFDLQLGLVSSQTNPVPGQQFALQAVLDNLGPGSAHGFVVDFTLPQGLILLQASGEGWQCASLKSANLQCAFSSVLGAGSQTLITLDVEADGLPGTNLPVHAVTYVPNGFEQNAANSEANLSLVLGSASFLTQTGISGSANRDQVRSGEQIEYSLEIHNQGSAPVSQAYVEAILDGPARFVAQQSKAWSCALLDNTTLRCNLSGTLQPGTSDHLTFSAVAKPVADSGVILMNATLVDANDPENTSEQFGIETLYLGLSDADLRRLLDDAAGDDEIAGGSIGPIEEMCLAPANAMEQAFCEQLFRALEENRLSDVRQVLRAVNPRAVITQTSSMVEVSSAQFRNIDARMNQLRAGGGGFSMNGLNLRYGDQSLQLASLRYLMDDSDSALQSGLASPWGFFVNGTISAGDRDPTTREIAFDFSSTGITAGVDYRFSDRFVLGAALGYANFGSDDAQGGSLDTSGYTLTGYMSWYPKDQLYIDARLSQGWLDVDQKRSVSFTLGTVSQDVLMSGSTSAGQTTLALASGMHFNREGLVFTPNVAMRYMSTSVDGYDERATGIGAVRYSSFDFDSLELSAGLQMNKSISLDSGVLTPQLDASFRYETQNDGMVIEARLLGRQSPFLIRTDDPDRGYGTLGGGLVYVTNGGKQFYFTYRQLLGLTGFTQYTVNLGLRMEF